MNSSYSVHIDILRFFSWSFNKIIINFIIIIIITSHPYWLTSYYKWGFYIFLFIQNVCRFNWIDLFNFFSQGEINILYCTIIHLIVFFPIFEFMPKRLSSKSNLNKMIIIIIISFPTCFGYVLYIFCHWTIFFHSIFSMQWRWWILLFYLNFFFSFWIIVKFQLNKFIFIYF